jgi:glycosyltransferase involved in cell wall biosynthesis
MVPLVSIVIAAFNAEKYLEETIRSALAQTWTNTEIIVVDDGSADNTLQIAKAFESKTVKVISQENRGLAASRNVGNALAQGDFIQTLDADDLLTPNKISFQLASKDLAGEYTVHTCAFAKFHRRRQAAKPIYHSLYKDLKAREWLRRALGTGDWFPPHAWLVSKKLTDLAGPWDERQNPGTNVDGEYFCRVVSCSRQVKFTKEALCLYRIGNANSQSQQRDSMGLLSLALSVNLTVDHLLKVDDTKRAREAAVAFLQHNVDVFRLGCDSLVWQEFVDRARELGGGLRPSQKGALWRSFRSLVGQEMTERLRLSVWRARCRLGLFE